MPKRHDTVPYKFDKQEKKKFVEVYRQLHGHITDTCRAIGISRQTYYDNLEKDPRFADSLADANAELNDEMRQALIHKAQDGDTTALIFWLKYRHPDFKQQPFAAAEFKDGDKSVKIVVTRDNDT